MGRPKKVLVAMSGGVDSSVAACLLAEQGYDLVGVFMRLGLQTSDPVDPDDLGGNGASSSDPHGSRVCLPQAPPPRRQSCCSAADAGDARSVAAKLGIPFYVLNFERDFSRLIDYFADEYAAARTPNPCILCNQQLKFGRLLAYAEALEVELIATGHYARVDRDGPRPRLRRARYRMKDQSYVLFGMNPAALRRAVFPLGEMTKEQVRDSARRLGLSLHDKPESQDICFVPDRDYARLVHQRRPEAFRPGPIQHVDGRTVGRHEGLAHFTIGQRRGLRVAEGRPVYVTDLDRATNTVTVGPRESLLSRTATADRVTWLCRPPTEPIRAEVQIRYHHQAAPAEIRPLPGDRVRVVFDEPQLAITPGQAMVFYRHQEVLGGGWIDGRPD
jgi:tRNA-specific 2-thiouridylase